MAYSTISCTILLMTIMLVDRVGGSTGVYGDGGGGNFCNAMVVVPAVSRIGQDSEEKRIWMVREKGEEICVVIVLLSGENRGLWCPLGEASVAVEKNYTRRQTRERRRIVMDASGVQPLRRISLCIDALRGALCDVSGDLDLEALSSKGCGRP